MGVGKWKLFLLLLVSVVLVTSACASTSDLEATQQQVASAQKDLEATRQDLAKARLDLAAATSRLTALEGETTAAKGSLDTLISGQNTLKQSIATAQGDLSTGKKDLDALTRRRTPEAPPPPWRESGPWPLGASRSSRTCIWSGGTKAPTPSRGRPSRLSAPLWRRPRT